MLTMILRKTRQALRHARTLWRRWSPARDQAYHDSLFSGQTVDPFRTSYPGYITIRRFADLAAPYLESVNRAIDLGCGPGEITCELARRYPKTHFEGIDHSQAGIKRAKALCKRLGLTNATFHVADVEQFEPSGVVDLIVMFDSFHHLADPEKFVSRMSFFSPKFFLIEPRGDKVGRWNKQLDLDWLMHDLDKIRARLSHVIGDSEPKASPKAEGVPEVEEPMEHRYHPDDFATLFKGFGIEIRGTIAGLDSYPPSAEAVTPVREWFGEFAYELYKKTDEMLLARDLDLLAKQITIYAERGGRTIRRNPPDPPLDNLPSDRIKGPYDARYLAYDGPNEASPGEELVGTVTIRNDGWRPWSSFVDDGPDFMSYHWLNRHGTTVHQDGLRTHFPRVVGPGEVVEMSMRIRAPEHLGRYMLALDVVQESTTWYSEAGCAYLKVPFRVRRS